MKLFRKDEVKYDRKHFESEFNSFHRDWKAWPTAWADCVKNAAWQYGNWDNELKIGRAASM